MRTTLLYEKVTRMCRFIIGEVVRSARQVAEMGRCYHCYGARLHRAHHHHDPPLSTSTKLVYSINSMLPQTHLH
ncbi:hypothetical protein N656DRAFT_11300 [Canariomyces notabilis]|uniref:Uncharacterized protein n=1 Tax=Canariomyces notabilis TaxID=2074819 RepID=A0AAN6TMB0_9PEZI|nr:hypothetical protein N656DRAFT_11300 [Canariomyces arenarius]